MRKPVSFSMEACPILSATHSVAHTEAEQSVLESAFMAKRSVMERLWGHMLWPEMFRGTAVQGESLQGETF